jgi:LDH2 family malate/lactate/ureidoglycolate dehydrogenase
MKVSQDDLRAKLIAAASKVVSNEEAGYFADEIIEAHLRKSPRSNPLKQAVDDLRACAKNADQHIQHKINLPSFVSLDFHGHGPLIYIKRIHDELEKRALANGMAMMAFTNSRSMHTLHTWVQGLAKCGLMAIAICNGGPNAVVPFNGTRGLLGTNPLAYGIPGEGGKIYCVDMATSEIPYFEILAANENKQPLRERSAVDRKGEFTQDASAALDFSESRTDPVSNIVPMGGGYKGYYLVYLMEIMTSALIGTPASPQMSSDFVSEEHGAVLMAFSPKAMGTEIGFGESVEAIHRALRAQKPKAGESILVPGETNNQRFESLRGGDIEVEEDILQGLMTNAKNGRRR